jgi:tight adherence protein C
MTIVFISLTGIMLVLYLLSFRKYTDDILLLDEKVYRFKRLLSIGLYILDIIKYKYKTIYDRKLLTAIIEISGRKQAFFFLKIHWGNKIILLLMALLFAAFIGSVSKPDTGYILFCLFLTGGIVYFTDKELYERVKRRRFAIRMDFPDFVNKLTLLINAGLTVTKAWERVSAENKKETHLYRELNLALQDIKAGKPEHRAYEEFAKRCCTPEITRFVSVILQNMRKGNYELVPILRVFANDCWEMRKNSARKYGEEASTRMLLPMMLMFAAILIIVGTPAVLALRNIS